MRFFTKLALSSCALFVSFGIHAQNQTAIVGEATQIKFTIANVANTKKCHIEVTLPDQTKSSVEVDAPDFLAKVDFIPQKIGSTVIQWEGKNKIRGVNTVFACPGKGAIQLDVNASTEQITQKWNQYFSQVSDEVKECVKYGMDASQFKYQVVADPNTVLTSPDDAKLKPIYQKCESFAKQGQLKKAFPCLLPQENNVKSTCDGIYAEKQSDGKLKPISRATALQLHFDGKPWVLGQIENTDAKTIRLKQDEQNKAKQAAEQAAKLKQEEETKAKQAAEQAAKLEAEEKERKFKESPEYKKQQAELERKKVAEEKQAAALKAKEEKDALILCKTNIEKCLTTEMLINNFQGVTDIRKICAKSVKGLAKWDYQIPPDTYFTSYYNSPSDLKEGKIRLFDEDIKFQNGFGAWKTQKVICHYDIKTKYAMSFGDN